MSTAQPKIQKIEVLKQTTLPESVGDDRIGRTGDVVEISTNDANYLVGVKHAKFADKGAKLERVGKPTTAKKSAAKAD